MENLGVVVPNIANASENLTALSGQVSDRRVRLAHDSSAMDCQICLRPEVHFTIDVGHYESRGWMRKGVCSTFWPGARTKRQCGFSEHVEASGIDSEGAHFFVCGDARRMPNERIRRKAQEQQTLQTQRVLVRPLALHVATE